MTHWAGTENFGSRATSTLFTSAFPGIRAINRQETFS